MKLRTYSEAAGDLRVSERTVERLVSCGELATVKVRRSRRISDAEIDRFICANAERHGGVVSPFRRTAK